jgi:hypothetical protein
VVIGATADFDNPHADRGVFLDVAAQPVRAVRRGMPAGADCAVDIPVPVDVEPDLDAPPIRRDIAGGYGVAGRIGAALGDRVGPRVVVPVPVSAAFVGAVTPLRRVRGVRGHERQTERTQVTQAARVLASLTRHPLPAPAGSAPVSIRKRPPPPGS